MSSATTDRRIGLNGGAAFKVPCKAASTANLVLSGEQTVDGVACVTGDRVLVKNQTDQTTNGIWVVSTASWTRDLDFDGNLDAVTGTQVMTLNGSANSNSFWRLATTGAINFGSSLISFARSFVNDSTLISFIQSGTGAVARTVQDKARERVSVLDFGAVGDGVTDDYTAIQTAITYAYNNQIGIVYLPKGTYNISKPLYLWGSDNYIHAGVRLVGAGVQATSIVKTSNSTLADGTWYAATDAVVILSKYLPWTSGHAWNANDQGAYNIGISDMAVSGYSTSSNTYCVYSKDNIAQVHFDRVCLQTALTTWQNDGNIWLSSFKNMSMHPTTNGFYMNRSGTSIQLDNTYVLGGTGVGYNLQAIYSSANSIACDGVTGTPYSFAFSQWTINGLGCECAGASGAAINVSSSSNVIVNSALILCPSAFVCSTGCNLSINSPQIGSGTLTARSGFLWFVGGTGSLSIADMVNSDTFATPNTGFANQIISSTPSVGAYSVTRLAPTKLSATPATDSSFATSDYTVSVANGSFVDFVNFSGMVILSESVQYGTTALFICGASTVNVVSYTGSGVVSNTNASGDIRFYYNAGTTAYRLSNNSTHPLVFSVFSVKTRAAC